MSKSRRQPSLFHGYHGWGAVVLSALLLSPTIAARTFLSALLREVAPTASSASAAASGQNRATAPTTEAAQTPRRSEDDEHALVLASDDDKRDPRLDLDPEAETVLGTARPVAAAWRSDPAVALLLLAHAAAALAPPPPAFVYAPPASTLSHVLPRDRSTTPARPSPLRAALPPRAPPFVFAS